MAQISPYLMFNGNCQEVLDFYGVALGGKATLTMRYSDNPHTAIPGYDHLVMYSEFAAGDLFLFASDPRPDHPVVIGSNFNLYIKHDDLAVQAAQFANLSAGGSVDMDLVDTPAGSRFGMLTDKFGISWMFNTQIGAPSE